MQKVTLTNPNHLSQIRLGLEDRIMKLSSYHHNGVEAQIQECYDAYLSCGGYIGLESLRGWAKPAPKTVLGWVKEIFGGA